MFKRSMLPGIAAAAILTFGTAAMAQSAGATDSSNPPGTAASRALDRAAGTNTSGAYPTQSDGTNANPRGTAASRTLDRAAGTNTSGAYPSQTNGTRANPHGTAASRAAHRATTPTNH